MKKPRRFLPWLLAGGLALIAILVYGFWRAAVPPQPSAFYTPPEPLPAGPPGMILRSEPITRNVPDGAQAWRVLYLSTGVDGEPIAVSGIIAAPLGESTEPRPVVAWAHGTLGVQPACGTGHLADPFGPIPEVQRLMDEGFVLAATDYPGLGTPGIHPYLIGDVEAASVLDSVRAAQQLDTGAGDRYAVWGHSQGGHAALWTAITTEAYAPELELVGVAAVAPGTDLEGTFQAGMNERVGSILTALTLTAWSANLPGVNLNELVKPDDLAQVQKLGETCVTTPAAFLLVGNIVPPSDFLLVDPTTVEPFRSLMLAQTPTGAIDVPLYIAHGTEDEVIPFAGSVAEAARRCAEGEDVEFDRYPGDGHNPVVDHSAVGVIGWIEDRFAGRPTGPNCGS